MLTDHNGIKLEINERSLENPSTERYFVAFPPSWMVEVVAGAQATILVSEATWI